MNIRFYILRRIALVIPTLIGLSILTFSIARIVPGDPVGLAAGPRATEEIKEAFRREFGLDQPLPIQYINYMGGLFRGDWGAVPLYAPFEVIGDLRAFWPATLRADNSRCHYRDAAGRAGWRHLRHVSQSPARPCRPGAVIVFCQLSFVLAGDDFSDLVRARSWAGSRLANACRCWSRRLLRPLVLFLVDSLIQLDIETFACVIEASLHSGAWCCPLAPSPASRASPAPAWSKHWRKTSCAWSGQSASLIALSSSNMYFAMLSSPLSPSSR